MSELEWSDIFTKLKTLFFTEKSANCIIAFFVNDLSAFYGTKFFKYIKFYKIVKERSAVGLVRKFLSTRESLLQALKKRNEMASVGDFGYSVIQRKNKSGEQWSESSDLPPSLPELIMV